MEYTHLVVIIVITGRKLVVCLHIAVNFVDTTMFDRIQLGIAQYLHACLVMCSLYIEQFLYVNASTVVRISNKYYFWCMECDVILFFTFS